MRSRINQGRGFFCKFSARTVTSDIEHRMPIKAALADIDRGRSSSGKLVTVDGGGG